MTFGCCTGALHVDLPGAGAYNEPVSRLGALLKAGGKNLAALLVGLAVALAAAEALLALLVPPPLHYRYPQPLHDRDAVLGWTPTPGQKSYTIDKPVIVNSLGFRSPDLPASKRDGDLRVLCLGDSQTFGNGVDQDKTYPARLEALLRSSFAGRRVDVINAGVQAYDTAQEVDLLQREATRLSPDLVTVGFYLNDIGEVLRTDKTTMVEGGTGEFARRGLVKQFMPYRLIYLLKRSRLITFLGWRVDLLIAGGRNNPMNQVLEGRTPAALEGGWRRIEEELRRARALAEARGFRLIVFPVPTAQEFLHDYPHEQYRSRFLAIADRLGLESFDPTPSMKSTGGGLDRYFIRWDGHIGPETHDRIARMLMERIVSPAGRLGEKVPGPSGRVP